MQTEQFQLHANIEQRHWWFVGRRRIMGRLIAEVLPPSPKTTIIDVGCGTGANIASLAADYECIGIDTSAEAIELAQQRFPRVRFLAGRAPGDLGEQVGRAKLFSLMDVLEHVPDDFAVLSELLAASTPGTYFLLTVPADEALWSPHDESFGHYRRYDLQRFQRLWADLPVSVPLLSYFNSRLYPLIRMIRDRGRRRGRSSGAVGTDFWMPAWPLNGLLTAIFAGEARVLSGLLRGRRQRGYSRGASLVAMLRREPGEITVRAKPSDTPPDHPLGYHTSAGQ